MEFEFIVGQPRTNILKMARYLQLGGKFDDQLGEGFDDIRTVRLFHFLGSENQQVQEPDVHKIDVKKPEDLIKIGKKGYRSKYEAQLAVPCVELLKKVARNAAKEREININYTCFVMLYPREFRGLERNQLDHLSDKIYREIKKELAIREKST